MGTLAQPCESAGNGSTMYQEGLAKIGHVATFEGPKSLPIVLIVSIILIPMSQMGHPTMYHVAWQQYFSGNFRLDDEANSNCLGVTKSLAGICPTALLATGGRFTQSGAFSKQARGGDIWMRRRRRRRGSRRRRRRRRRYLEREPIFPMLWAPIPALMENIKLELDRRKLNKQSDGAQVHWRKYVIFVHVQYFTCIRFRFWLLYFY